MTSPTLTSKPINERLLLALLAAIQFTHIMDFMIMMPLGSQLMRVFSINPEQFSHLVMAYGIAAAITGFLGGFVIDRFDRKHALLTLYPCFGVATLACALAPNYVALLVARFAAGACGGMAGSVVIAMVSDVVPPERRGQGLGVVMSAFPLASILGVPTGLWLADRFEWHAPFFLIAALALIITIVASQSLPKLRLHKAASNPWRQMSEILTHPVHIRGFLVSGFLVLASGCVIPFMAPAMVANVGIKESQLWLIYLAGGLLTFFSMPFFGRLSDRHDKLTLLSIISVGAAVAVVGITRLPPVSIELAMLATALFMVAISGRFAPATAMVANAVEAKYRGGFMSVNSAVQQGATSLANLIAGLVVTEDAAHHLIGYPKLGLLSVVFLATTCVLAAWLRAIAPHSSRPAARVSAVAVQMIE